MPRVALKALTYCLMHFIVAVAVTYALTRSWQAALAIGILEPLAQTVFFTLHDRLWARADRRKAERETPPAGALAAV